jgi:anti-sigma28 factor (negative regulator of flagellin synthesis)
MRIRAEQPDNVAPTAKPLTERARSGQGDRRAAQTSGAGDRVQVSDDARLLNAAVAAVHKAPDASEAAIERARQKRASGELGRDAERLADKVIDSLLR